MTDEENDRPAWGKRDPLEASAVNIKMTLTGQGGELETRTFEADPETDAMAITRALTVWIEDMILDIGDSITIEETT